MLRKLISSIIVITFICSLVTPIPKVQAQNLLGLPEPGTMVSLSPAYEPALIKGVTVHKDNPFLFDFIIDTGASKLTGDGLKKEGDRLIKYFFAALTIPDKDLWVNLSPYEKDRMAPQALGQTALGRDLLAQDYMLKQLTASLIYPEKELGKNFWDRVYAQAREQFGTTNIPVNTFNKVWIIAERASVYEHNQTAFIVSAHLKVMLEEDYLSLEKHTALRESSKETHTIASQIVRSIILPAIEHEVNTGKNFAMLRQIFYSQILATWFKRNLKEALLSQVYADKSMVKGVNLQDTSIKEKIYQRYLQAYKKGAFNFIKEDVDLVTKEQVPRKYFSGGMHLSPAMIAPSTQAGARQAVADMAAIVDAKVMLTTGALPAITRDAAMAPAVNATKLYYELNSLNDLILAASLEKGRGMRVGTFLARVRNEEPRIRNIIESMINILMQQSRKDNQQALESILRGKYEQYIAFDHDHESLLAELQRRAFQVDRTAYDQWFEDFEIIKKYEGTRFANGAIPTYSEVALLNQQNVFMALKLARIAGAIDVKSQGDGAMVVNGDKGYSAQAIQKNNDITSNIFTNITIFVVGRQMASFFLRGKLKEMVFSKDSKYIGILMDDNRLFVYPTDKLSRHEASGQYVYPSVYGFSFSDDPKYVILIDAGGSKAEVRIRDEAMITSQPPKSILRGTANILLQYHLRPNYFGNQPLLRFRPVGGTEADWTTGLFFTINATKGKIFFESVGFNHGEKMVPYDLDKIEIEVDTATPLSPEQIHQAAVVILDIVSSNTGKTGLLESDQKGIYFTEGAVDHSDATKELLARLVPRWLTKVPIPSSNWHQYYLPSRRRGTPGVQDWKDMISYLLRVRDQRTLDAAILIHGDNGYSAEVLPVASIRTRHTITTIKIHTKDGREFSIIRDGKTNNIRFSKDSRYIGILMTNTVGGINSLFIYPLGQWDQAVPPKEIKMDEYRYVLDFEFTEDGRRVKIKNMYGRDTFKNLLEAAMDLQNAANDDEISKETGLKRLVGYTIIYTVSGDESDFIGKVESVNSKIIQVYLGGRGPGRTQNHSIDSVNVRSVFVPSKSKAAIGSDHTDIISYADFLRDHAQVSYGGIDLNTLNNGLSVSKDANGGVVVTVDPAMIERVRHEGIGSATPVIINMEFLPSVDQLLGL